MLVVDQSGASADRAKQLEASTQRAISYRSERLADVEASGDLYTEPKRKLLVFDLIDGRESRFSFGGRGIDRRQHGVVKGESDRGAAHCRVPLLISQSTNHSDHSLPMIVRADSGPLATRSKPGRRNMSSRMYFHRSARSGQLCAASRR
jgi:hypothetical protein